MAQTGIRRATVALTRAQIDALLRAIERGYQTEPDKRRVRSLRSSFAVLENARDQMTLFEQRKRSADRIATSTKRLRDAVERVERETANLRRIALARLGVEERE